MKHFKINSYLFFKLPAAWISGVRVQQIEKNSCTTRVRHRWINQNHFRSMFWAVQGMAAELSTGVLVMNSIKRSNKILSMLVVSNNSTFEKKARGKIKFYCTMGEIVEAAVERAINTGNPQEFLLKSTGTDEKNDVVSIFEFKWSVKVK